MTPSDLKKFCGEEDTWRRLREPFSRGDFTYATDGRIGVRVPRIAEVTNEEGPDFEKLFLKTAPAVNSQPFPAVVVPPRGPKPSRPCKDKLLPIEIAPGLFFSDEVVTKLQTLPGLKFDLRPFDGAPHRFEFDGGDGLAMPMMTPSRDDKHAVRLPADTKETAEAVA